MTIQDLETAILWLESNEGESGESDSCQAAAEFLKKEVVRRQERDMIKAAAKEHGISPRIIRKALRRA